MLILDILKGVIALTIVASLFHLEDNIHLILLSVAVVSGHNWTLFLQFNTQEYKWNCKANN